MTDQNMVVDYAHELISSRRVEGTPVYNRKDERLGAIHAVMIEKRSGKVAYAVLSFGGFLGMKEHVHPVPWEKLTYDVDMRRPCGSTRPTDPATATMTRKSRAITARCRGGACSGSSAQVHR